MISASNIANERPAWFVAANTTGSADQTERFARWGVLWENLCPFKIRGFFHQLSTDLSVLAIGLPSNRIRDQVI